MRMGVGICAAFAVLVLVGCGGSSEPDHTGDATEPDKQSKSDDLILNFPWELNLTLADVPVGWTLKSESYTFEGRKWWTLFVPTREDKYAIIFKRSGQPAATLSSEIIVYPDMESPATFIRQARQEAESKSAVSDVAAGDEGFMFARDTSAGDLFVSAMFRRGNVIATVWIVDEQSLDDSVQGVQQWAKQLDAKITANASSVSFVNYSASAELNLIAADLSQGWIIRENMHHGEQPPWLSACKRSNERPCDASLSAIVIVFESKNLLKTARDFAERQRWRNEVYGAFFNGPDIGDDNESFFSGNDPESGLVFVKGNILVVFLSANADTEVERLARIVEDRIESSKYYIPSQ